MLQRLDTLTRAQPIHVEDAGYPDDEMEMNGTPEEVEGAGAEEKWRHHYCCCTTKVQQLFLGSLVGATYVDLDVVRVL